MKKLLLILILALAVFALAACGDDDDGVPDGMQLVNGGDDKGYYFYAPEEFTVSNLGDVDAVYVSNVNTTSITFTEIDKDAIEVPADANITILNAALGAKENYFLYQYLTATLDDFPEDMTITEGPVDDIFGAGDDRADGATYYKYTYKYGGVLYGFTQYFAVHGESFYILTYSAINEKIEGFDSTRYDQYYEKLDAVVENFRFVDKTGTDEDEVSEIPEGYRLVSDKTLAGFEFYAHSDFELDYASAIVSVSAEDGANVNLTKATATGTLADDYMKMRFEELLEIVDSCEAIGASANAEKPGEIVGVKTELGNCSLWAFAYEYVYEYGGESYRVYQILAVDGSMLWADGYVFTYTAKEASFDEHFPEVLEMAKRVVF